MIGRIVEDISSGSDSDYSNGSPWFLSSKGNEYFCEVDEDYILDRFNLTGLNNEVSNYGQALDLITDNLDDDIQDELRGALDVQARLLYGLIHARWIVTARGLAKMLEKYKRMFTLPNRHVHGSIDGAYFGTSFPHLFFMIYPNLISPKVGPIEIPPTRLHESEVNKRNRRTREEPEITENAGEPGSTAAAALKADRYRPRIYGFQVHEIAKLQRWQEAVRDRQVGRLEALEDVSLTSCTT
ncbi:casein kinase II, regulatory subunit, partial [Pisolithus sp. B1]